MGVHQITGNTHNFFWPYVSQLGHNKHLHLYAICKHHHTIRCMLCQSIITLWPSFEKIITFISYIHYNQIDQSDMLTSDDRKEVDLHLQRGSIARDILELVIFKICHNSMMYWGCLN